MAEGTQPPDLTGWPKEEIPGRDILFMRVHRNYLRDGNNQVPPGVFQNRIPPNVFVNKPSRTDGMSTNWSKYCETAHEARNKAKQPDANAVIRALVDAVRSVPEQVVEHTPIQPGGNTAADRSHADVFGEKSTEVRAKLSMVFEWAVTLGS